MVLPQVLSYWGKSGLHYADALRMPWAFDVTQLGIRCRSPTVSTTMASATVGELTHAPGLCRQMRSPKFYVLGVPSCILVALEA